jgi:hypothetical protein
MQARDSKLINSHLRMTGALLGRKEKVLTSYHGTTPNTHDFIIWHRHTLFFLLAIWKLPELRVILTRRMTDRLGYLTLAVEKPTIYIKIDKIGRSEEFVS